MTPNVIKIDDGHVLEALRQVQESFRGYSAYTFRVASYYRRVNGHTVSTNQIHRRLVVLEKQGLVRRDPRMTGVNNIAWEMTNPAPFHGELKNTDTQPPLKPCRTRKSTRQRNGQPKSARMGIMSPLPKIPEKFWFHPGKGIEESDDHATDVLEKPKHFIADKERLAEIRKLSALLKSFSDDEIENATKENQHSLIKASVASGWTRGGITDGKNELYIQSPSIADARTCLRFMLKNYTLDLEVRVEFKNSPGTIMHFKDEAIYRFARRGRLPRLKTYDDTDDRNSWLTGS